MTDVAADAARRKSWRDMILVYFTPVMAAMVVLGFASGLPLYMVFQKLSYWLRDVGIDRSTIGFFYWVTFAYSFKFIWAPVIDRWKVPVLTNRLGHRRSWMIVAIVGTCAGLAVVAGTNPHVVPSPDAVDGAGASATVAVGLLPVAIGALLLAFSGASLDVSIDAWRIESASTDNQANMAAAYSLGYRFAYMFSGIGLIISEFSSWHVSFLAMAAAMAVCGGLVLLMREPPRREKDRHAEQPLVRRMTMMFVEPFKQVFARLRIWILPVLILVAIYRLSDFTMGVMASPLYSDLEFNRAVIGGIQSGPGVLATMGGLFLGGIVAYRFGVMKALIVGGIITFLTNGAYAWLAATAAPDDTWRVALAIISDNIAGGFVTTVFIAYLSSLTDPVNAATQYALFSSIYSFFAKGVSGFSGRIVDWLSGGADAARPEMIEGYVKFFLLTAGYAIPATLLVIFIMTVGPPAAKGLAKYDDPPAA